MKAVLMSIQPKRCEKIANGEKTIEVRKTKPKLENPFKCYIYCTKGKLTFEQSAFCDEISNGKVIGEFICDRFYGITNFLPYDGEDCHHSVTQGVLEQTCLEDYEIDEYLGKKDGYGWHISQLKIYDKPKELSEFWTVQCTNKKGGCYGCEVKPNCIKTITRPPQSWCYVEEK